MILNKYVFLGIMLASFPTFTAAFATNYNLQPYTTCRWDGFCYTALDVSTLGLNTARINNLKSINITNFLNKVGTFTGIKYSWTGNTLNVSGYVPMGTSNYWSFGAGGDSFDPWWNVTSGSQLYTSVATSCGTAGGGGNYFYENIVTNITGGTLYIKNVTFKSTSTFTNLNVNITDMNNNILYSSNNNTSKTWFFANAALNASSGYRIKWLTATRTSCTGVAFPYQTSHYNVTAGGYCSPINSCNNLTSEWFDIESIGSDVYSTTYYIFNMSVNGFDGNISIMDTQSINASAWANTTLPNLNITIYQDGVNKNSTVGNTTYIVKLPVGLYNFTATTNNSDSVTRWVQVNATIYNVDTRICFTIRPDVCVDTNTRKVYLGGRQL